MWIFTDNGNSAYNTAHITRLFVEETGSGAALKAEIAGKTFMVAYFPAKPDARATLQRILEQQDNGGTVIRL